MDLCPSHLDRPGDRLVQLYHSRMGRPARSAVTARGSSDPPIFDRTVRHIVARAVLGEPDAHSPADPTGRVQILHHCPAPPASS